MNDDNQNIVDDIINFFERFGASNELSKRNFDTGDFYSEDYCNFILYLGKKYGLYDESKEAKDVNYILNLEDDLSEFFRKKLIAVFNL
ncbi:hypothetical protein [Methanobrevibacter sp.]|uniref:hypothetical protein n=1 Tax=Methanobrevibacter sp. TaxID=66852 RepID=UPI00386D4CAD